MNSFFSAAAITTAATILTVNAESKQMPPELNITPVPLKCEIQNNIFKLTPQTVITAAPDSMPTAKKLAAMLRPATGYKLPTATAAANNSISLRLTKRANNSSPEEYRLQASPKGIRIIAPTQAGLYYGCQTLLQLLPPQIYGKRVIKNMLWTVPACLIEDKPRFSWRGMHLDPSRKFIPFTDLLQMVDVMAMHKLNLLHLHLTDSEGWRLQINAYPKLTAIGAKGQRGSTGKGKPLFYTKKQIRKLIAYAAERHITVMPEIDVPGHCGAVYRSYPELCINEKTLNVAKPETMKFVNAVFSETAELFPGQWIHFGGDEVRVTDWRNDAAIRAGMKSLKTEKEHDLLDAFYRDVADLIVAKGKTPVGWDEIANAKVNKKAVVMWWRSYTPQTLRAALDGGYQAVLAPNNPLYLNFPAADFERGGPWRPGTNSKQEIYALDPVPKEAKSKQKQILGVQCCIWGEFMDSTKILQYMTLPRLAVVAELSWSAKDRRNFNDMINRLEKQKKRYAAMGVNYRKGYTLQKIGSIKGVNHTIAPATIDISKQCSAAGYYLVRIAKNGKGKNAYKGKVELLADGKAITAADTPVISGSRRKWPKWMTDYILPLESYKSGIRYTLQLSGSKGDGTYTVSIAAIQPEGFGPIDL